jgi:hypothetical protein
VGIAVETTLHRSPNEGAIQGLTALT